MPSPLPRLVERDLGVRLDQQAVPGLQVESGLDGVAEASQGEFVELADVVTDPRPIQPGQIPHVSPTVAGHRDSQDIVRVALLKFHAQRPRPV